jgi:isopenicillin N synthase-like dioxygenase
MREVSPVGLGKIQSDEAAATRLMDYPDSTEEIPTIDISSYLAGVPGALKKVAAQLRETTESVGFFYLKGHGIPQTVIDRAFAESKRFHELPLEQKMTLRLKHCGLLSIGYEPDSVGQSSKTTLYLVENAKPNYYAFLTINREGNKSEQYGGKTLWPENLPGFREGVTNYLAHIETLAMKFLPLCASMLELPDDYFDKFFTDPQFMVSLLHYPPQKEAGGGQYGIAPHVDTNFMTFLAQTGKPALAVQMPSGHWRLVDVIPGTLLVNAGQAITCWTNDRYSATKHRVINTSGSERHSIAAFFGPNADALLECLPTCQGPGNPPRYPARTYAELRKEAKGY